MTDAAADPSEVILPIREESDVFAVRHGVRSFAGRAGLHEAATDALVIAVSEIARNIVVHAGIGRIQVRIDEGSCGRRGVVVIASDDGPGIVDIDRAMEDGYSTGGGLGLGLSGARRLADEFEITSIAGNGTIVVLKKWVT